MHHEVIAGLSATLEIPGGGHVPSLEITSLQHHGANTLKSLIQSPGGKSSVSHPPSTSNEYSGEDSPDSSSSCNLPSSAPSASDEKNRTLSPSTHPQSSCLDNVIATQNPPASCPIDEESFIIEELQVGEDGWDSDSISVIRPHQYEDADSDLDSEIASEFRNLTTDNLRGLNEHEAFVQKMRAERRWRRRSSVRKRTISMSIGSDTDDEDLRPIILDANEAGSSARRLRRCLGDRATFIFDDTPERIEELDEGSQGEEKVVEDNASRRSSSEDEGKLQRELLYLSRSQIMDVDSA